MNPASSKISPTNACTLQWPRNWTYICSNRNGLWKTRANPPLQWSSPETKTICSRVMANGLNQPPHNNLQSGWGWADIWRQIDNQQRSDFVPQDRVSYFVDRCPVSTLRWHMGTGLSLGQRSLMAPPHTVALLESGWLDDWWTDVPRFMSQERGRREKNTVQRQRSIPIRPLLAAWKGGCLACYSLPLTCLVGPPIIWSLLTLCRQISTCAMHEAWHDRLREISEVMRTI